MKTTIVLAGSLIATGIFLQSMVFSGSDQKSGIKPYTANPRYWQYNGKPTLLIGATDNDNLFQNKNLKTHLDSLQHAGGNYVRNTMSDRDAGNEKAFHRNTDGKYDLTKWNAVYWKKFEDLLRLSLERDIIVQIEIWDRFDHSREPWVTDPYNPKNNVNYTYEQTKLDSLYPNHPGSNSQIFFYSVPDLQNNETLLHYQRFFVEKLLSISLKYGNVLYCIDNETNGAEEWATYWASFIKSVAGKKEIYLTQMWDNWDVKSDVHKRTLDNYARYGYIDISQNSHILGHENWENAQYVFNYSNKNPRPVNSTKIYGSNAEGSWSAQGKTAEHAIQTFFRNLTGGFASSRFHRPAHGLGLSTTSINCLKTVREIEAFVKFWEITPRMDLLIDNEQGEAYVTAKEGENYLVYFTRSGQVKLDLSKYSGKFTVRWIDINTALWTGEEELSAGTIIDLHAKCNSGCFAVIIRK